MFLESFHLVLSILQNLAADSLTDETERDLLIALSQVFSQVKQWTDEFDSDEELSAESVDDRACSLSATSYTDTRHCLAKIIGDLMLLLAVNIQHAQHLVGNTLVAISEFVLASRGCPTERSNNVLWKSHSVSLFFGRASSFIEDGDGFSPVICRIINLVPKLTAWCHSELQTTHHDRISHYLRHKTLDDILFEMLLQLFRLPFYLEHHTIKNEPLAEAKGRPLFIASDLFNPIHLFHLFLAEIHYDHQVLLDYLISKDTGSSCAEYLLRSIRIVCNSWRSFIEFPGVEEGLDQLCPKRQRVLVDSTDLNDGRISSLEQCNEGRAHGKKGRRNYRLPFVAARDCLVSLRTSINSLNQKNLFPYNPQVLLRRHFCGDLSSYSHGRTTLSCLISEQRLARHAI
ncbi:UNVERIFIED_CONTAM: hypothetical protein Sradi_4210000, partial [Sesamum radiatum]